MPGQTATITPKKLSVTAGTQSGAFTGIEATDRATDYSILAYEYGTVLIPPCTIYTHGATTSTYYAKG